jgi:hypothetical protein
VPSRPFGKGRQRRGKELENEEGKVMRSGLSEYAAGVRSSAFEPNFISC